MWIDLRYSLFQIGKYEFWTFFFEPNWFICNISLSILPPMNTLYIVSSKCRSIAGRKKLQSAPQVAHLKQMRHAGNFDRSCFLFAAQHTDLFAYLFKSLVYDRVVTSSAVRYVAGELHNYYSWKLILELHLKSLKTVADVLWLTATYLSERIWNG